MLRDAIALATAVGGALLLDGDLSAGWAAAMVPLTLGVLAVRGGYRFRLRASIIRTVLDDVLPAATIAFLALIALQALSTGSVDRGGSVVVWMLASGALVIERLALGARARRRWASAQPGARTVVVGSGEIAAKVIRLLEKHRELGLRVAGYVDDREAPAPGIQAPWLGSPEALVELLDEHGIGQVIVAFSSGGDARRRAVVEACRGLGVEVLVVPRFFESIGGRTELEHIGGLPLLRLPAVDPHGWGFRVKHAADRVLAALLLVLLGPLLLAIAALVKLSSPGPVFFPQRRVGYDGRVFYLYKFRSMRSDVAGQAHVPASGVAPGGIEGDDRRTAVGRWLRRWSLDELPQLVNVLRGEMSLVGPRPERPQYVEQFCADVQRYGERHRVRSGITGWAQINGSRGQTSLSERAEWDNYYIDNWSLRLDFLIMLFTVPAVLSKRNAE